MHFVFLLNSSSGPSLFILNWQENSNQIQSRCGKHLFLFVTDVFSRCELVSLTVSDTPIAAYCTSVTLSIIFSKGEKMVLAVTHL